MALNSAEMAAAFSAAVAGIMRLGKAKVGDKTMVDAYKPAADAMQATAAAGETSIIAVLEAGVAAASAGYQSTANIVARKGRASYVGERGIGKIDPGAFAGYLLIKQLHDVVASFRQSDNLTDNDS